jgi:transketolase
MNQELLSQVATIARGLAIDAVHASNSGHLGLPLGTAEIGAVLFGHALQYDPDEPRWINRDRFVLSAGHGSMFLYGWLHLAGFDLPLDQIKQFRQLHSHTPGHPEFREAPGVDATTGPLGQGVGNAVGYAISAKMLAARFNTPQHTILDYHVISLLGDGCMQEGVASEAAALAAHLGLDNLILIYDSNNVTLDAMARITQSENTAQRFEAYGFDVVTIDGHNMSQFLDSFERAKREDNGRPKLIIAKTEIGRGIPEVAGTAKAHGEGGAKFAVAARKGLGLPEQHYYVSASVREFFAQHKAAQQARHAQWRLRWDAWRQAHPDKATQLQALIDRQLPDDLADRIPPFAADYADATRGAGGVVIQALAAELPGLVTGSADLFGSTKNYIKDGGDFSRDNPLGRNIWFGIREHAMAAVLNGMAYDGLLLATGATFTVFADYMRPSIRLAALSQLPVIYILTHDSVGVGEDGPTHQPVETCSGLRVIPGLDVSRPADPEEVAGAFVAALQRTDGPSVLLLTRQKVPTLHEIPAATRRDGAARGGYVIVRETALLERILIATGSEVALAIQAARQLGPGTRVVSLPCWERFERQSAEYRESVLPASCRKRIAVEAGVTGLWWKYVGDQGRVVGIDRFGLSAPGEQVMQELGITVEHVVAAAK